MKQPPKTKIALTISFKLVGEATNWGGGGGRAIRGNAREITATNGLYTSSGAKNHSRYTFSYQTSDLILVSFRGS